MENKTLSLKFKNHQSLFQHTFQERLSKFFHPILGFDIVKFDDLMHCKFEYKEDGKTSCSDFVKQRFGENIQKMIEILLSI